LKNGRVAEEKVATQTALYWDTCINYSRKLADRHDTYDMGDFAPSTFSAF